ncbi:MAG: nucleotidyltransferase [Kiritimatiellae bacterium]|nr:nucleotidyltransferase [Kiritimatiellia bacterium]
MPAEHDNTLQDVFRVVADVLAPAGTDCLLIGGFAVNHYGFSRSTLDIDLMILDDRRDDVREIMKREGFTNVTVHENVMFLHRAGALLRVDVLQVDADTMGQLLSRAEQGVVGGKTVRFPALRDLIAMKLFALAQNPERRMAKDLPDIAQ